MDCGVRESYRATTILTRLERISVGGKVFTKLGNAARQLIVNKSDKRIRQTYCVYNSLIDMGGNSLYSLVFCGWNYESSFCCPIEAAPEMISFVWVRIHLDYWAGSIGI